MLVLVQWGKKNFLTAEVDLWIDVASIKTGDERRDGHLKSADFFDAEQFPHITFQSNYFHKVKGDNYKLPPVRKDYSGIIISLTRQEWPDMSVFNDPEIVWRMEEPYHVGLVVRSKSREKVIELLDRYADIIQIEYHASAPAPDRPMH